MPLETKDGELSKIDVTPQEKETKDGDDIFLDAVCGVPANKQTMSDEHQDLTGAEDESLIDEITRLSTES